LTDMLEIGGHGALRGVHFGKAGKGTHPLVTDQAFMD
jgi:hypothetical protein